MRLMHAVRSLFLEALAQPVHAHHALLLHALDGDEMHARARGGFAHRGRVVGVVLAAASLRAIRRHQTRCDEPGVKPRTDQLARPVVRTRACFHRHHAPRGQLRAPGHELVSGQRSRRDHATAGIHRVHLDHALGQINTYPNNQTSCNLAHGTSPFQIQIDEHNSILVPRHRC